MTHSIPTVKLLILAIAMLIGGTAIAAPMSGNYTINAAVPTGGVNYQTFTAFAADLAVNGVSGAVVATVAAGSGPYTEQVLFNSVAGISSTNTITIEGNGEVLQYSGSGTFPDFYTMLIATDYFTVNNLQVKGLNTTNGIAIYITGNAKRVTITNCTAEVTKTNSTSSAFGILVSGETSYLLSGSLSDSLVLSGNTVIGGYTGIQLTGEGFASGSTDSTEKLRNAFVYDNDVQDFYATGIWINYTDNATLSGNRISRPTRTNSGSDSQTPAGITITSGSTDFLVEKNRIFDFAGGGGTAFTSLARGVFISGTGTALTSGTFRNNLIYGLDNNHSSYGMQINSWSGLPLNIYHNTIVFDQTSGTTVSPAFPNSGYQSAALNFGASSAQTNINVRNNIFFVRRDGNVGKRFYYINNAGSIINSDYNVFYSDGLGAGTTDFGYKTSSTQYIDLAAWQLTGEDAHSVFADPQFTDPINGNFLPANPLVTGEALATVSVGVTHDILDSTRSIHPDPGAFEGFCGPQPEAGFTFTQSGDSLSFSNTSTGATGYHWTFGVANDSSTDVNPSYVYADTGTYDVTLIVINDCGSDTFTQTVTVSMPTHSESLSILIQATAYPNPADGNLNFAFTLQHTTNVRIDLVDVFGRVVLRTLDEVRGSGNHVIPVETELLPAGIYNLVVYTEKQTSTFPVSVID